MMKSFAVTAVVVAVMLIAATTTTASHIEQHVTTNFGAKVGAKTQQKQQQQHLHDRINQITNNWNIFRNAGEAGFGDQNGGSKCAACTLLVGLFEQVMQLHNNSVTEFKTDLCDTAKHTWEKHLCETIVDVIAPAMVDFNKAGASADVVCNAAKLCVDQTAKCRLFPKAHARLMAARGEKTSFEEKVLEVREKLAPLLEDLRKFNICTILPEVCQVANHLPAFDSDGDKFSTFKTLRGSYWRGKDCDDLDASIHPGVNSNDGLFDQNCNGIVGTDAQTGKTYEEMYCKNTSAMGVAILGDSATAHFRIPPGWLTASNFSFADYGHILRDAENELDWPMLSWSTGHLNASEFHPDIFGPVDSIYLQMRKRNLCNNNDFQNLGVNGAKSTNLLDFSHLLGRVKNSGGGSEQQKPLMLLMAMIGNDVCNHRHDFSSMTSAEVYRNAVREAVLHADTVLEKGSKIVLVGLADGRVLYEYMHNRIHPIGKTNHDVTYTDVYDFLNCLHISPCWGWMNSNATVRNMTTDHANLLSQQLFTVQTETKAMLNNSEVIVITDWIDAIKDAPYPKWELIEPVDGFHPSQLGNFLLAQYFWNKTVSQGAAPPVNPHNEAIAKKFGL